MRRSVKYEIRVMLHKKEFALAFCVMLAFCVFSFIYAALGQWGVERSQLLSADSLFMGVSFSSTWYYFVYLFAFIIVLPHSMSYINDLESGVFSMVVIRSGKMRYYLSKLVAAFIGNVIIIAIPFIMNLILCHMTFSSEPNYLFGEYGLPNYFRTVLGTNYVFNANQTIIPFVQLFLKHSALYNLMYIGFLSAAAGVLGAFLVCFSFLFKKRRAILFIPIYIYILFSSVISEYFYTMAMSNPDFIFRNFDFMDYFAVFGFQGKSILYLMCVFLLLILFCVFSCFRTIKADVLFTGHEREKIDKD